MTLGRSVVVLLIVFGCACAPFSVRADMDAASVIRFGLTSVVVKENLRFIDRWAGYLAKKIGRPVQFIQRRSYREIMDMLDSGSLDFAWICGFPFVQRHNPEFLDLMAVPLYAGKPLYRSYIIVQANSYHQDMTDLKGGVFAFSDPDSNSGFLYPKLLLAERGQRPETYFRHTFFTFSHAETVQAVAEGVANGGAVDSYIWDYLDATNSDLTARTRIIRRSPEFGFPPLVARRGLSPALVHRVKVAFITMSQDPEGRTFLDGLKLDGFEEFPPDLFASIGDMAEQIRTLLPQSDSEKTDGNAR